MYLLIFEDGGVYKTVAIEAGDLAACDAEALEIIDISNPEEPLRYFNGEWEKVDGVRSSGAKANPKDTAVEVLEGALRAAEHGVVKARKGLVGVDPNVRQGDADHTPAEILLDRVAEYDAIAASLAWAKAHVV